jgi:hypothetical protein
MLGVRELGGRELDGRGAERERQQAEGASRQEGSRQVRRGPGLYIHMVDPQLTMHVPVTDAAPTLNPCHSRLTPAPACPVSLFPSAQHTRLCLSPVPSLCTPFLPSTCLSRPPPPSFFPRRPQPPQLAEVSAGGVAPSWRAVAGALLAEEGLAGMWRGVAPRMVSSACWGTAMVSGYEFLKRICALPPP